MTVLLAGLALAVGFAAGLFTFKVKTRWCTACGAILHCPDCAGRRASG
jgi:NADH pyrophosphatase NudC (nudix superfamily)